MNRLRPSALAAGLLALLLVAWPSWGQKTGTGSSGSSGSGGRGQPGGSVSGQPGSVSQPSNPQFQTPIYINGRVLMDTGQPVPEPVSVALYCGMGEVQAIHTDIKGYFQFTFGAGPQSNRDLTAADSSMPSGIGGTNSAGPGNPGGFGGMSGVTSSGGMLGCELRVSVSGYQPITKSITDPGDIGQIDAGTLELRRIAGVQGSSISVTSLQVPNNARKEFEKGDKDLHSNHVASGTQHLEKAVAEYDKYAAAWTELGEVYADGHAVEKAKQAYGKAIASDPQYIPPYVGLAALELQTEEYDAALDSAGKVLSLDPRIGLANYLEAVADLKLGRTDDAQKSAEDAEKEPHQSFPQVHVLLANLYLQRQDYSNAAAQMRAYLKESPRGSFAPDVKKSLEQIEKASADTGGPGEAPAGQTQIAP